MSLKMLEQIGLSEEQAKIYSTLISHGTLPARKIASYTGINRSLIYKITKELIAHNLVIEHKAPGKISTFTAEHPSHLQKIIDRRNQDIKLANQALVETVGSLGAQFNLTCNKPSIYYFDGLSGIEMLNRDIIDTKAPVRLIRSPFDNNTEDLDRHAKKLLESRAAAGISTQLIVPIKNTQSTITPEWDVKNLIERRRVPREELHNPAQIVIYGNKVALTSFADCMITTIVEDQKIADSFAMLFDIIWNKYAVK